MDVHAMSDDKKGAKMNKTWVFCLALLIQERRF